MDSAGRQRAARASVRANPARAGLLGAALGGDSVAAMLARRDPARLSPAALLALQASAGNLAVQRLLAESTDRFRRAAPVVQRTPDAGAPAVAPTPAAGDAGPPAKRQDYVFIMGKDNPRSKNKFYGAAFRYFTATAPGATIVRDRRSLAAIFAYLREHVNDPIGNLYLVSHASQDGMLSFPLVDGDRDRKLTYPVLRDAITLHPELFTLAGQVDAGTTILIKGCNIGRSQRMIDVVDEAFGGLESVIAPTHKQEYEWSGKSVSQSFTTYFIEEPGNVKLSPADQEAEFVAKYPELPKKTWDKLVKKAARNVESIPFEQDTDLPPAKGAVKFANMKSTSGPKVTKLLGIDKVDAGDNIDHVYHFSTSDGGTADWTFHVMKNDAAIEAAKAKINPDLARPDMYRWRSSSRRQLKDGTTFRVTVVGERTEYDVGGKVVDAKGKSVSPDTSDAKYFGTSTYAPPTPPEPALKP